ncbi:MAG: sigma-54-dependent Fis family transcriptional regulator [Opitutus sp.]|nr:sigma-54-dependent Fis family transcriptional regulator [Opitutus sp.]
MSKTNSLFTASDRRFAEAVRIINASNPFLPERIAAERAALGDEFEERAADWNTRPPTLRPGANLLALTARCGAVVDRVRSTWPKDGRVAREDAAIYEAVVGFWLYQSYAARFDAFILAAYDGRGGERVDFFPAFRADVEARFGLPGLGEKMAAQTAPHLFASAFQIRRAFHNIFRSLVGGSAPMARLRAAIWQSIFTHDLARYRRGLHARMADFSTLITGPSGTGKELVARAIALSRYVAYEPKRGGFTGDFSAGFFPLNLAALSPTLIESELFGHKRGAFTGALADRAGWMEVCPPSGAVFLDEIGEVGTDIQVKLLRVLQSRTFQPLGSTESRPFAGKIIAATNRALPAEIRAGRFREDFYYRLCSDQVATPSLREQLDASADELETLVAHIAGRLLDADEAPAFTRDTLAWIEKNLGGNYAWPGNFRELEQCVRSLVLRGDYRPAGPLARAGTDDWNTLIESGSLTAEELLRRYTRIVFSQAGTVEETARRLDLDRRTVKARLS